VGGLSPFGEQVVKEMNASGIMVDVSHVSDDTVRDVLRITDVPVIASAFGPAPLHARVQPQPARRHRQGDREGRAA
jgi:microsomal dipeptidase-like Zn-dependent dipeptidase